MADGFRWQTVEQDDQKPQQQLFNPDAGSEFEARKNIGEFAGLEFLHVRAKTIINEVPGSSPMPFNFTINAYRGCSHACQFCFARPTHTYLNMNAGKDFETKIVVKVNAVEKLHAELRGKNWQGDGIAMGTNTDPYQRAEGKYRLTRGIIKELTAARNPFSILTKGTLVLRDLDLLVEAARVTDVGVNFSIPTTDVDVWRKTEPGAPSPLRRIEAVRKLTDAGISVGVLMAPILPGISDSEAQLTDVVERVTDAGAKWVTPMALHLRPGVKEHWMEWMEDTYPDLIARYKAMYANKTYLAKPQRDEVTARGRRIVGKVSGQSVQFRMKETENH